MGEVVYGTSSLEVVGAVLAVILVLFLVGLWGVINGIRRKHENMFLRIARGCAGVFFWLLALVFMGFVYFSLIAGSKTMTVQVNDKEISTSICVVSGDTCYVLNAQSNSRYVNLVVNEDAYNKVEIDSCYLITYFSVDGLFNTPNNNFSDNTIDTVTRIETAACP